MGVKEGSPVISLNCDRQQIVKFSGALRIVTCPCRGGGKGGLAGHAVDAGLHVVGDPALS